MTVAKLRALSLSRTCTIKRTVWDTINTSRDITVVAVDIVRKDKLARYQFSVINYEESCIVGMVYKIKCAIADKKIAAQSILFVKHPNGFYPPYFEITVPQLTLFDIN